MGLRMPSLRLLPAATKRDQPREEDELQVQQETLFADVQEIVAKLRSDVTRGLTVHLGDARQARAGLQASAQTGDLFLEGLELAHRHCPGADEAHVAPEDVQDL